MSHAVNRQGLLCFTLRSQLVWLTPRWVGSDILWCSLQMPDAWMEQKRQAVMKYRNLFIYTTAPQNEPSASDALIDLMCSYARVGPFQSDS